MTDSSQSRGLAVDRRTVLGAVGATLGAGVVGAVQSDDGSSEFTLRQGDQCVPIAPLSGSDPVEEFYDYRLPDRFVSAENGGSDPGDGPYYSSMGTEDLQRHDASIAFLYDGPEGLSLVVVHDKVGASPNDGGAVTFEVAGLPDDGEWVVKDDLYRDQSGALAGTNYDRWHLDGETHTIDWTWASNGTDGGAFRGLSNDASVTVRPAFNDDATLYQQHYEGTVDDWQFLTPDGGGVQRVSLDMTSPITVESGTCDGGSGGRQPVDGGAGDVEVDTVEFKGCGEAWIVFGTPPGDHVPVHVETSKDGRDVTIATSDLTTVPGQYGDKPLYKASGRGKVLAVEVQGERYVNDHRCAQRQDVDDDHRTEDDDDDDDDDHDDPEHDDADDRDGDHGEGGRGKGRGKGRGNGKGRGKGNGRPDHAGRPDDDDDDDDDDEHDDDENDEHDDD